MTWYRNDDEDEKYADARCVDCDKHLDRRGLRCRACLREVRDYTDGMED